MVRVKKEGVILEPTKLKFEAQGAFNPAVIRRGKYTHVFYRAWAKNNVSSIGYAKLDGPTNVIERYKEPILKPEGKLELGGIEDPRIVKINGTYYMTYVAYDGRNTRVAYATSKDLETWEKKGQILPDIKYAEAEELMRNCEDKLKDRYFLFAAYFKDTVGKNVLLWEKDAFFFPKKIGGKYALVHRITPDIQVLYFKNFRDLTLARWRKYLKNVCGSILLQAEHWYETRNIGGGCPPIETKHGWLMIYHAVDDMDVGRTYRAGVALLDKRNPQKVLGHHHEPLIAPDKPYEKDGPVHNVVFPTGTTEYDGKLYIYYGAADKVTAVASVDKDKLVDELVRVRRNYKR
tara:strand:- start:669 stop:1709 length:1041 start_codon:yes stop_codon:yes gene_type:complete